ncbi:hypothetical protein [uncultured Methanomethylovorans sp.]|uniref:hypothetical protein n=1 Tax=uncultured Methanomethylovorans sp. TaxID=183759 RepID=UPI002AA6252A|nr:hypothetical protein [uncultured Methanomethylovorans sp.]
MLYYEDELLVAIDVPYISTTFAIEKPTWIKCNVKLTKEGLQIKFVDEVFTIPFTTIEYSNRILSHSVINSIQFTSKYSFFIVIDHRKNATIGYENILFSTLLAGNKTEIYKLRYFLTAILGLQVDPLLKNLTVEEVRLLSLIDDNVRNVEQLTAIFDENKDLLYRTFYALVSKSLVDDRATLTSTGLLIIRKVKGIDDAKKSNETELKDKIDEVVKLWDDSEKSIIKDNKNKVYLKYGESSLSGSVLTEDIWRFLPLKEIKETKIEDLKESGLGLVMSTTYDSSIFLRAYDDSVIFTLKGLLDKKDDIQIRILYCLYLGIVEETSILSILDIKAHTFLEQHQQMEKMGILDNRIISNRGLDLIHKMIKGYCTVLLIYRDVSTRRLEHMRMDNSKKVVIDKLKQKHDKFRNNISSTIY